MACATRVGGQQPLAAVQQQRDLVLGRHRERVDPVAADPGPVGVHRLVGALDPLGDDRRPAPARRRPPPGRRRPPRPRSGSTEAANPQAPSTITRTAYPVVTASVADCTAVSRTVRDCVSMRSIRKSAKDAPAAVGGGQRGVGERGERQREESGVDAGGPGSGVAGPAGVVVTDTATSLRAAMLRRRSARLLAGSARRSAPDSARARDRTRGCPADDRSHRPDQALRIHAGRRRPVVHRPARHRHRIPRAERRRQVHDDADDPRPGQPDQRQRHHRRPALHAAEAADDLDRRAAGRQLDPSQPVRAVPPAVHGGGQQDRQRPGRRGPGDGRSGQRRDEGGRQVQPRHEAAARHRRSRCSATRRSCCSTNP